MATAKSPVPQGLHTVTPQLTLDNDAQTIDWYKKALGAEEVSRAVGPDGKVMHADLKIGDSHVMISEEMDKHPAMPCMVHIYVPNVDAVYQRALASGATSTLEPVDQFYGDRSGGVKDPSGNHWYIATHKEDVGMADLKKRAEEMFKKGKAA